MGRLDLATLMNDITVLIDEGLKDIRRTTESQVERIYDLCDIESSSISLTIAKHTEKACFLDGDSNLIYLFIIPFQRDIEVPDYALRILDS